jgi:hypothetical protein
MLFIIPQSAIGSPARLTQAVLTSSDLRLSVRICGFII